ncbi:putative rhamnosyl transferase [Ruegeria sp. 2205SS24-7]|uniref:putative rhamnosyl transferase n=1 Tax=Ruegeria discodermiae TaxID=3064389 RepID=UPI0027404514|nr:putative rhamnosyl transferase [Ruegeria sp. 2205SS24-7]MDP5219356.1 putative rhamnosyl transferase [Ruegeria sp. 2205SS24-7]
MDILGLCRFSYLGEGGFKMTHDTLDDRRAFLYQQERLVTRFRHFEAITLPSVAGQTDPDFRLLVVIGQDFPAPYLDRLQNLTRHVPQVLIRAYPPMRHRRVMIRAMRDNYGAPEQPSLQFRLDDDDAMGRDFIARFRETAEDTRALWSKHRAIAVDFNRGYVFRAGPEGLQVCAYSYAYSAIALGIIVQLGLKDTIMDYTRGKLWTDMPTVTFPHEDMMLRAHHDFNDSRMKRGGKPFDYTPLTRVQERYFKNRFNINNARGKQVFSRPLE